MSNVSLLVLSIIIILSSLSEKLEFFVHNEEVLLTLCFIAFIFFAYSYLSDSISEDFQTKETNVGSRSIRRPPTLKHLALGKQKREKISKAQL